MGVLVGLGVGIGLLLVWSAFAVPRRPPRVRRTGGRTAELLAGGWSTSEVDAALGGPIWSR